MPPLATVQASNAAFSPSYLPVAIFFGGTSGVGQAMAEALARQTKGHAHIIIIGRSKATAEKVLAGFPKPADQEGGEGGDGWKHEFVACDASSMRAVHAVCETLKTRLRRVNFLVMTAGGLAANSISRASETEEGINEHLVMRYFSRYLFTRELLPLLQAAHDLGQHAHIMTIQGAGFGVRIPTSDLGVHEAYKRRYRFLQGVMPNIAAIKGLVRGMAYNDGLVAHFAAQHPTLTFTHISPGQVLTATSAHVDMGWLWEPVSWFFGFVKRRTACTQDDRAQYMLYALFDPAPSSGGGLFLRGDTGDVVSQHVCSPEHETQFADTTTAGARKYGLLHGTPMKGYGGSDAAVRGLVVYTEEVLAGILGGGSSNL
ncbi:hypothetical protein R3P38DRAFT_1354823 [Favolaschia claudopus]|uniref:Uncharacterized protein n=1 Tax=Favolaschia claudopus TaxID=2862362 RepID=A0AAW0DU30_9AGAR